MDGPLPTGLMATNGGRASKLAPMEETEMNTTRCTICGSKAGWKLRGNYADDETPVCTNHYRQNVAKVVRLVTAGRFQQPRRKKRIKGNGESNG